MAGSNQASKEKLRQKKLKKQKRAKLFKAAMAILLALLLIGTALAPVFSETTRPNTHRSGYEIVSDADIKASSSTKVDENYLDFIDFMMGTVLDSYYKDVNKQALIEGAYKGIFQALDPYSTYFTPEEYESFNTSIEGEFSGIGASISEGENGYIQVVSPIKGTPAEKAGLMAGDIIIEIDGVSTETFTTEKAVSMIRGEKGTSVKLTILRANVIEPLSFTIVRDTIIIKSVNYEILDGGIGYIELVEFSSKTNSEFDAAMAYMVNKDVKKLIVDVRNNPGGLLDTAIHVSDYFIAPGKEIVKIDYKGINDRTYRATSEKAPMEVAVLINGGSASASEIFAGSIQQTDSGVIIGTQSFGKGTVQTLMPLTNGGAVKLTIAEYKLAGNYAVHGVGIKPDVEVKAPMLVDSNFVAPLNMTLGKTSLNIYAAQQRLNLLGYDVSADGVFGEKTTAALKAFQEDYDIAVTGKLDTVTGERLNQMIITSIPKGYDPQLEAAIKYFE